VVASSNVDYKYVFTGTSTDVNNEGGYLPPKKGSSILL
jgi:hypothetical protein